MLKILLTVGTRKILMSISILLLSFSIITPSFAFLDALTYLTGIFDKNIVEKALQERLQKEAQAFETKLRADLEKKIADAKKDAVDKVNGAFNKSLSDLTGNSGPLAQVLKNAGIDTKNIGSMIQNTVGKTITTNLPEQLAKIGSAPTPEAALAAKTAMELEQTLAARTNVYSMLDEKPTVGTCKNTTADKCTILTILREQDAVALDALQRQNIASVAAQVAQKGQWGSTMLAQVDRLAGKTDLNVLAFLTPSPSLPLGFEANAQTAPTLEKSMWLSQILVGTKNDSQFLTRVAQDSRGTDNTSQIDAMSKIAKIQLARSAILNVHNEFTNASLNSQFRACVVRPDAQDRIGSTQEQHLVHIQSLLRCNNMIMLQLRQQELEGQRLQGAMLLTLLDLYAVQEPVKQK